MVLEYFIWDPSPNMFNFNLPILNRPLLWYGFLFAFGFFVGYFVLTYLLRRYFLLNTQFVKEDIVSWPDLIQILAQQRMDTGKQIFLKLNKPDQHWCQNWRPGHEIPETIRSAIITAMNSLLSDAKISFPFLLSSQTNRLYQFVVKHLPFLDIAAIKKRLQIEQEYAPVLASIQVRTTKVAEQLTFYVIIAAIVGSRLGDVIFYQNWHEIARHPSSIIAVWQGGLSSHGGAAGILLALFLFAKRRKISFWTAVDFTVIPTAIAAVFIRIGNFFNQEILGKATALPWGIVFLHPADGGPIVPRHPAQLYEAAWYLCAFILLLVYWHRHPDFRPKGRLTGLFLVLIFGFRLLIEFLKVEQSVLMPFSSSITMGQWLSLPFLTLGFWLLLRKSD